MYSTHRDASTDIFQYDITLGKPNETQFALCETLFAFTENLQFCSYLVHARNPSVNQMITMVISKEDTILIESLYQTKGTCKLIRTVPQKNWTKGGLGSLITC